MKMCVAISNIMHQFNSNLSKQIQCKDGAKQTVVLPATSTSIQNVDNYAGTSPIRLHLRLLANTLCAQYAEAALHCYELTTALISTSLFHRCSEEWSEARTKFIITKTIWEEKETRNNNNNVSMKTEFTTTTQTEAELAQTQQSRPRVVRKGEVHKLKSKYSLKSNLNPKTNRKMRN